MTDSHTGKRVLVVSGDTLPLPGLPTTGAGLRAWGLGKGLESRGHDVHFLMPAAGLQRAAPGVDTSAYEQVTYDHLYPQELNRRINVLSPDVIVFQHWVSAVNLSERQRVPVVIDFHGPLLLETLYQDLSRLDHLSELKIRTLLKADYFTCAGEQQRHYFYAWLLLAGFDVRDDIIQVVPVSMSSDTPEPTPSDDEVNFVYGGVFLPWQDPSLSLETLVQALEARGTGRLKFFGGTHAHVNIPPGKYGDLLPRLETSSQVDMMGMVARDALIQTYLQSHVAIDVMARNPERELAFTTRTVEYLWCGLPVIYNNYAELARHIHECDAGWIVDPQDAGAIRSVVESILDDPSILEAKSHNAQALVRERLSWERTIEPLDAFVRRPCKRQVNAMPPIARSSVQRGLLERSMERAQVDVRAARRAWPLRGAAIVREAAKRLLKRRYVTDLYGRRVVVDGPLLPGWRKGQRFRAKNDELSGIDLLIGTYDRLNSCNVVLHLQDSRALDEDVAISTVNAMLMYDCSFCTFAFPPIPNSANREFCFWVESPDAVLGDCVMLFRDAGDNSLVFAQRYD